MEYFLSRLRFLAAQNDSRHLNVAKTGALRVNVLPESARHDRYDGFAASIAAAITVL